MFTVTKSRLIRTGAAILLIAAAGTLGYMVRGGQEGAATIAAPPPDSVRVIYSLDAKQNDKEIIALIAEAKSRIYFAMYEFTLRDIADALVAAKERGVEVRGLVDSGESANATDKPVIEELLAAHIPIEVEKHVSGTGIMHIKAIVTDRAYALGSYNWTASATTVNDEILEIGTDPVLRQTYENILKRLLDTYAGNAPGVTVQSAGTISYTDAPKHVGEYASVEGTLVDAHTTSSGTTFLDFCTNYKSCPFTVVIFSSDAKKFGNLSTSAGRGITVTGKISSYQGQAEMILSSPSQLSFR